MAVADPDLDQFRYDLAELIGVPVREVGMLPDRDHLEGGGYHCGRKDLISIGRYHPPAAANVGSGLEDYSARQLRDRLALDDRAAAVDEPDGWGNGGNTAWIRSNNMILAQMQKADPALAALRAMNFTPDGFLKRRYDTLHPEAGVIPSLDTVRWHTHWEFWRNTLGTAVLRRTLNRLLVIIRAAIEGRPVPPEDEEDDVGASFGPIEIKQEGITSLTIPPVEAGTADPRPAWINFCNATGDKPYRVRVWYSTGSPNVWAPLAGDGWLNGERTIQGGERVSVQLPKGVGGLDVRRRAIDGFVYPGHLTLAIERGAVRR